MEKKFVNPYTETREVSRDLIEKFGEKTAANIRGTTATVYKALRYLHVIDEFGFNSEEAETYRCIHDDANDHLKKLRIMLLASRRNGKRLNIFLNEICQYTEGLYADMTSKDPQKLQKYLALNPEGLADLEYFQTMQGKFFDQTTSAD